MVIRRLMSGECILEARRLFKKYGDLVAVNGINFCVKRGEIFGFLGPNGAGKTTTVRMFCGLARITAGEAYIDGYSVTKEGKKVKKLIGVVPDISNLYSELTCLENLLFSGEMYGVPKRKRLEKAEELLRFFGLWDRRNTKFKNLSKGLKRRLTLAAALIHDPKILFLDEPTLGLDVLSKRAIWDKILKLNEMGTTIFLTTHNIYEAFEICERIAIINHGEIVAIERPENLKKMFSAREVLEVSFTPHNPPIEELRSLHGVVDVEKEKGIFKLVIEKPIDVLEDLAKYARDKGLNIATLRLREADAEEVFLNIIGEMRYD